MKSKKFENILQKSTMFSNLKSDKNISYFQETDFIEYRSKLIKKIDKDKITSSFIELRELGASLKSLILQPGNIDNILIGYEEKQQSTKKEEQKKSHINENESIKQIEKKDDKKSDFFANKKKVPIIAESTIEKEEENFMDQRNEENLKKILGNLEVYLSSNLKEIKDFRDAMSKPENVIQNNQSLNKFPDESYENTPLANNAKNERALFLKKIANLQEDNVNDFLDDLDKLTDEISIIENKANEMEMNKLIIKIKALNVKEEKNQLEIKALETSIKKIVENPSKVSFYTKIKISEVFSDEVINRRNSDYMNSFLYKEVILVIYEETIAFYNSWEDEEPFFQFEYVSISDLIEIFNNRPLTNLLFTEDRGKDEKKSLNLSNFNESQFSGFQVKFWNDAVLKALYIKCDVIAHLERLDQIFFLFNFRRTLKSNNEFIYKNPRYFGIIGGFHDDLSQSTLPKIQSNLNINSEAQFSETSSPHPHQKDKRSILNFDNTGSNKKKKVTHFQLMDSRNTQIESSMRIEDMKRSEGPEKMSESVRKGFDPEANFQNYLKASEEQIAKKKDSVKELKDSQNKLKEMDETDKILMALELNDPEYKLRKAKKNLANGFVFLKYGKMGEPHERFVHLNEEKNILECKAFNVKTGNKKQFEMKKLDKVTFGRLGANFQRYKSSDKNIENLSFSLIFSGGKRLDLESNTEANKQSFLDSFEVVINSFGGRNVD